MSTEAIKASGLEGLLAASLDDIDDLPTFSVPPTGSYKLKLTIETKKINEKDAIAFNLEVLECMEQTEEAPAAKAGDKFSCAYMIGNEFGLGKFKAAAKPIMEAMGAKNFAEILQGQVAGMEVYATVKRRADKDDNTKFYADVQNITPA